jgi:hypothetical protein
MTVDRILVGYDGGAQSWGALVWAVRAASANGAVVHVVTAWAGGDDRPPAVAEVTTDLRNRQAAAIRGPVGPLAPSVRRPVPRYG